MEESPGRRFKYQEDYNDVLLNVITASSGRVHAKGNQRLSSSQKIFTMQSNPYFYSLTCFFIREVVNSFCNVSYSCRADNG